MTIVFLNENGEEYIGVEVKDVRGQGGNDTITSALNATEPGSTLFGNSGDDYIRSRGIGDKVFGGRGDDTIASDNGQAIIYGDLSSDYLFARETRTTLFGGRSFGEESADDGENTMVSAGGKNILVGGGGDDTILGEDGEDTLAGGGGDDSIKGGPNGASYLFGNIGIDILLSVSTGDPDTLFGGRDNDMVTVDVSSTADNPLLFGGVGDDSLMVAGSDGEVEGAILVGDANPDGTFGGSEGETGGADYLYAASGANHELFGNDGNDRLEVGVNIGVGVSLFGGRGNDLLTGGSDGAVAEMKAFGDKGDDTLTFTGSDSEFWGDNPNITSGFGNNVITVTGSGNTLRGGNDNSSGSESGNNVIKAIAAAGGSVTDNLLMGGAGNDTIDAGSSGAGDTLDGGAGGDDKYIFTKGQTIVSDTLGINTYFGIDAVAEAEITVRPVDKIGGEANFFIPGDQSNSVTDLEAGGVRTEGGNDFILMDTVTGKVDTGDGEDRIEVGAVGDGEVPASVNGGAGDDLITVTGTDGVTAQSTVSAGAGDDTLNLTNVAEGAFVFGSAGENKISVSGVMAGELTGGIENDSIVLNEVAKTGVVNTGDGNDTVEVKIARAGATFTASGETNRIFLDSIGAALDESGSVVAEGEAISFTGGDGADRMGLTTDGGVAVNGSTVVSLNLNGGGGNDLLQGGPFKDVINGGAGDDILYGGAADFDGNVYNGFEIDPTKGSDIAANFVKVTDGEEIFGGAGNDRFVIRSTSEVGGELQTAFGSGNVTFAFGTDNATVDIKDGNTLLPDGQNFLVGTNGQFVSSAEFGTSGFGTGFFTGAVGIDTLTDFTVGQDTIFLERDELGGPLGSTITIFTGKGALFGGIVDSGPAFGPGAGAGTVDVDADFTAGSNVFGANNFFQEQFVFAGSNDNDAAIDFNQADQLFFDKASKGLYVGNGNGAQLIARLPDFNPTGSVADNTFVDSQTIGGLGGGLGDLALF